MNEPSIAVTTTATPHTYPIIVVDTADESAWLRHTLVAMQNRAKVAVLVDENIAQLWPQRIEALQHQLADRHALTHVIGSGEQHKNRAVKAAAEDAMLGAGVGRDGGVIAIGGGVTGDLAGYVAATYMRGIPIVHVPTTIVAMVDSAIGGKTGIDVPAGKNLVGAFHQPLAVVTDVRWLRTLPHQFFCDGMAEVVKHAALRDDDATNRLLDASGPLMDKDPSALSDMISWNAATKADVVCKDEKEGNLRQILNLGHTLGHALEAANEFRLSHGQCVAWGLVKEAELGVRLGLTATDTPAHLRQSLARFGLDVDAIEKQATYTPEQLLGLTRSDKKTRAAGVKYVLLQQVGTVATTPDGNYAHVVADEDVLATLQSS